MSDEPVLLAFEDGVATVTLNRPESRNALGVEMTAALRGAFESIAPRAGEDVHAVLFTGVGKAFCAGGDIKAMRERRGEPAIESRRRLRNAHRLLETIMTVPLPVIAVVGGAAAGAGCNLALTCDFVLASPRARFIQSFGRMGLIPDYGGLFQLPRIVGLQKARELIFTARSVGAEEARQLGMVCEIFPEEELAASAHAFARRFREASSAAIGHAKALLARSFETSAETMFLLEADGQSVVRSSPYHQDCVDRFLAKEPLRFDWERLSAQD